MREHCFGLHRLSAPRRTRCGRSSRRWIGRVGMCRTIPSRGDYCLQVRVATSRAASAKAIEMCNNNGHCRKFDAGHHVPELSCDRDEQHLTRGRANTLHPCIRHTDEAIEHGLIWPEHPAQAVRTPPMQSVGSPACQMLLIPGSHDSSGTWCPRRIFRQWPLLLHISMALAKPPRDVAHP